MGTDISRQWICFSCTFVSAAAFPCRCVSVIDHLVLRFSFEINETRVHINNKNELKIAVMYQNLLATVC